MGGILVNIHSAEVKPEVIACAVVFSAAVWGISLPILWAPTRAWRPGALSVRGYREGIVELRARLAQTAIGLAGILEKRPHDGAEARALRDRAKGLIEPLQQSGALAAEFRGLAGGRPRRSSDK
jgi:hypothetical protein